MTQPTVTSLEINLVPEQGSSGARLQAVRNSYVSRYLGAGLLVLVAASALLVGLVHHGPAIRQLWVALAVLGLLAASAWWAWPLRQLDCAVVAQRLDRQFPELQDSTGLLLQDPATLTFLGQLQCKRVAAQLTQLTAEGPGLLPFSYRQPLLLSAGLLLGAALCYLLPARPPDQPKPAAVGMRFSAPAPAPAAAGQAAPPRISATKMLVTPPAYTRLAAFAPSQPSFQCPQEARVRWQVRVTGSSRQAPVLELGRQWVHLQPVAGQTGWFFAEQSLTASTLYRLRYAGTVSDDYAIDVRPDLAPVLRMQTPKSYTLVAAIGQRPEVPIRATVRDDYGLSRAELVITVAQGQGEAVKFRELRRDLSAGLGGPQASLGSLLNLPQLGLTYGDELYFYLTARDNHGHSARTDSYLVQWQDTAGADSAPDLGMGVKVAPAYFRSQRQIIIDTEKLLAEKPKLNAATVASRANDLGFDQQTLRLRYGKFLGEEAEAGIGAPAPHSPIAEDDDAPASPTAEASGHDDHDHGGAPASPSKASPTAETDALMDPYIHKHDDAETADFLEPAVKAKLHAVLDQMWAAELRLRTGRLAEARPFEYRALRLLKEVQQQTRAYVKKAGFTPPPMPEATLRLTGELAGAAVPQRQQTLPAPNPQPAVRAALRWLAAADNGQPTRPADAALLDQAGTVLAGAALTRPGFYLPALRALRELSQAVRAGRATPAAGRALVGRALTDLLAAPAPAPAAPPAPDRLAQRYFQLLSR